MISQTQKEYGRIIHQLSSMEKVEQTNLSRRIRLTRISNLTRVRIINNMHPVSGFVPISHISYSYFLSIIKRYFYIFWRKIKNQIVIKPVDQNKKYSHHYHYYFPRH